MPRYSSHTVKPEDRKRIKCVRCMLHQARHCLHVHNRVAVSFEYYCGACWRRPGRVGPSPMALAKRMSA